MLFGYGILFPWFIVWGTCSLRLFSFVIMPAIWCMYCSTGFQLVFQACLAIFDQ